MADMTTPENQAQPGNTKAEAHICTPEQTTTTQATYAK